MSVRGGGVVIVFRSKVVTHRAQKLTIRMLVQSNDTLKKPR